MKNKQFGFVGIIILIAAVLIIGGAGYFSVINKNKIESDQIENNNDLKTNKTASSTTDLSVKLSELDILNATYPLTVNIDGKSSEVRPTTFKGFGAINSVSVSSSIGSENFTITRYEYTDSKQQAAKVYVSGNFGASGNESRVFMVTSVSGKVVVKEI